MRQKLTLQEAEIKRLSDLHGQLQTKIEECDGLSKQLELERSSKQSPSPSPPRKSKKGPGRDSSNLTSSSSRSNSSSSLPKPTLKKVRISLPDDVDGEDMEMDFDSNDDLDDDILDPDWKKTPLFKRIRSMKVSQRHGRYLCVMAAISLTLLIT